MLWGRPGTFRSSHPLQTCHDTGGGTREGRNASAFFSFNRPAVPTQSNKLSLTLRHFPSVPHFWQLSGQRWQRPLVSEYLGSRWHEVQREPTQDRHPLGQARQTPEASRPKLNSHCIVGWRGRRITASVAQLRLGKGGGAGGSQSSHLLAFLPWRWSIAAHTVGWAPLTGSNRANHTIV